MIRKNYILLMFLFGLLVGCSSDRESPIGSGVFKERNCGRVLKVVPIVAVRDSLKSIQFFNWWSTRGNLLVGYNDGVKSSALLRFGDLPSGSRVLSASLRLIAFPDQPDSSGKVDLILRKVVSEWSEVDTVSSGYPDRSDSILADFSVDLANLDTVYIPISDTLLLQDWIDHPENNYGIAIEPSGSVGSAVSFGSRESTMPPRLKIIYELEGTVDSSLVAPDKDLFFVEERDISLSDTDILISDGDSYRALLKFNMPDSIKTTVTVNSAYLKAGIVRPFPFDGVMHLEADRVRSESWDPKEILFDVGWSRVVLEDTTSLSMDVRTIVQRWISHPELNNGLLLRSLREPLDLSYVVLRNPVLEIIYSEPPEFKK